MSEKIYLWRDKEISNASIVPFLVEDGEKHPAILVIPGGGYGMVCEYTEGHHIAMAFNQLGYHAFVLDYRVAPNRYPAPQQDAIRAVKFIRGNADKWNVIPDKISSCGFSAGGHLHRWVCDPSVLQACQQHSTEMRPDGAGDPVRCIRRIWCHPGQSVHL